MSAYAWYPEIEAAAEADERDALEYAMEAYEARMLDYEAGRCSFGAAEDGGAEYDSEMLESAMELLREELAPAAVAGPLSEVTIRRAA